MNSNSMFHFIKHLSLWLNICYKATHLEITITTELFSYWKARDGENIYCGKTSLPIVLWTHPHKKSDHKRKNGYTEKKLLTFSSMCKCISWMSFLNVLEFLHLKMYCNNLTNSSFWQINRIWWKMNWIFVLRNVFWNWRISILHQWDRNTGFRISSSKSWFCTCTTGVVFTQYSFYACVTNLQRDNKKVRFLNKRQR